MKKRPFPSSWWPAVLAGLAGLIASISVWFKPYVPYGYDSLFHLFSLFSLDQRIAAGDVYPLRFPSLAFGYGWAELSYYPPLSPYFLEILHLLGANYVVAYKLGITLFMVGAALSSYALGAALFNRYAGLIAAVVYVFNPYFLSLISPRGALAEMLGLAVAPILFLVIYRTTKAPGWRTYLATSLTGALLILTHPLSAFLFAPFILAFGGVALASAARAQRKRALVALICATFTAALLSCFYWLPSQTELGGIRTFDFPAVHRAFSGRPQALSANPAFRLVWRRRTWLPSSDLLLRAACPRLAVRGLLYRRLETTRCGGGGLVPLVSRKYPRRILADESLRGAAVADGTAGSVSAVPLPLVWPRGALLRADYRGRLGSGRRWSDWEGGENRCTDPAGAVHGDG